MRSMYAHKILTVVAAFRTMSQESGYSPLAVEWLGGEYSLGKLDRELSRITLVREISKLLKV